MAGSEQDSYPELFAQVLAEWNGIEQTEADTVCRWVEAFALMSDEMDSLKLRNQWLSGGFTLMHALGLQHNEVYLCRALAWLLRPDAGHGLGASLLEALASRCNFPTDGVDLATVVTEESRDDTRADVVVRLGDTTVVIEAKVFAAEQAQQCERLAALWSEESPVLIFLTRDGARPKTAGVMVNSWHRLRWRDLGQMIADAARRDQCSAGVYELVHTIEAHGG